LIRQGLEVGKFSTGMKRRLALARLSLSQTKIWLLDEPLFGLDQKAIEVLIDSLQQHRDAGGAVLMISHDLAPFLSLINETIDLEKRGSA